jgi:hypothetical protein
LWLADVTQQGDVRQEPGQKAAGHVAGRVADPASASY